MRKETASGKHFETVLPAGYREVYCIDAQKAKTGVIMNVVAAGVIALILLVSVCIIQPEGFFDNYSLLRNWALVVALVAYIVLHEVTHGVAYKCLTGRKLTFGLTLTVAYCGVPDVYVYRRAALISLLAPFVLFFPVFLLPALLLRDAWDQIYAAALFALHVGGCVGDLYGAFLYCFRFRDPSTLMQDTGPKQTFYQKG